MKFYPYKSLNPCYRSPIVTFTFSTSSPKPRLIDQLNKLAASSSVRHYLKHNNRNGYESTKSVPRENRVKEPPEYLLRPKHEIVRRLPSMRCYNVDNMKVDVYDFDNKKCKEDQNRKYKQQGLGFRMQPYATMMLKDEEMKNRIREQAKEKINPKEVKEEPLQNQVSTRTKSNNSFILDYTQEATYQTNEDDNMYVNGYLRNFKPYIIN